MPKTIYTDKPLRINAKDHEALELGEFYDWEILSAEERIASGTELMEIHCAEVFTEAACRLTIFFTDKTAPQVSRWLSSMGIERQIGSEVEVNEDLIKGRRFSAKIKKGKKFTTKDGEEVEPWEIDGFSCRKPSTEASDQQSSKPAESVSEKSSQSKASAPAAVSEEGW